MNKQEIQDKLRELESDFAQKRSEGSDILHEKAKLLKQYHVDNELVVFQMGAIFSKPQWIPRHLLMDYKMPLPMDLSVGFEGSVITDIPKSNYLAFRFNGATYDDVTDRLMLNAKGHMFPYDAKVMELDASLSNL